MPDTQHERIHCAFTMYTPEAFAEMAARGEADNDSPRQWWVSLDGQEWLPVNRPPVADTTVDEIRSLFGSHQGDDGRMFLRMRWARRYLNWAVHGDISFIAGGAFMPNGWYATSEDIDSVTI